MWVVGGKWCSIDSPTLVGAGNYRAKYDGSETIVYYIVLLTGATGYRNFLEASCFGYTHLCNLIKNIMHFLCGRRERNLENNVWDAKKLRKTMQGAHYQNINTTVERA